MRHPAHRPDGTIRAGAPEMRLAVLREVTAVALEYEASYFTDAPMNRFVAWLQAQTLLAQNEAALARSTAALQQRVEALVHVTALSKHEEGCISTYGNSGVALDYLEDDLFNEQCECGVAESLRNMLDTDTIEAVRTKRAALALVGLIEPAI